MGGSTPTRPRRRLRRAAWIVGILGIAGAGLIVFAGPPVAAAIVPRLAGMAPIEGRVEVRGVSLSWLGAIRADSLKLYEPDGTHAADISLHAPGGMLGLLDGTIDGTLEVGGWAHVRVDSDGTTTIDRVLGTSPQQGANESAGPNAGRADPPLGGLRLAGLDLVLSGSPGPPIAIADLRGEASLSGQRLTGEATGLLRRHRAEADAPRPTQAGAGDDAGASLTLAADIDWQALDGTARLALAGLDEDLARAAGAWLGTPEITDAVGVASRGGLDATAGVELENAQPVRARVEATSGTVGLDAVLSRSAGALRLERGGRLALDGGAFLAQPTLAAALVGAGAQVHGAGAIEVRLTDLGVPMGEDGPAWMDTWGSLEADLRELRLVVPAADATEPATPAPDTPPADDAGERVAFSDLSIRAQRAAGGATASLELTGGVRLGEGESGWGQQGTVGLTADVRPAGVPALRAWDGGAGQLADTLAEAILTIEGLPTRAIRPWLTGLEAQGVDLVEVAGERIGASLTWKAAGSAADLALDVQADTAHASGRVRWTDAGLELVEGPARVRLGRAGAFGGLLPEGWRVAGGQASATIDQLALATPRGLADIGLNEAAAAIRGRASVELASVEVASESVGPVLVDSARLDLEADKGATGLRVASLARIDGRSVTANGTLRSGGLEGWLNATAANPPATTGDLTLTAETALASLAGEPVLERTLGAWAGLGVGPSLEARVALRKPEAGEQAAATIALRGAHANARIERISLADRTLRATGVRGDLRLRQELWAALSDGVGLEGSRLDGPVPLTLSTGPISASLDSADPVAAALAGLGVELRAGGEIILRDLPVGEGPDGRPLRRDVTLAQLAGTLENAGGAMAFLDGSAADAWSAQAGASATTGDGRPIATLSLSLEPLEGGRSRGVLRADGLDVALAADTLGLDASAQGDAVAALGTSGLVEATISLGPIDAQGGPAPQDASLLARTPALRTPEPLRFALEADTARLARPARLAWRPDPAWLGELLGVEVRSDGPMAIELATLSVGGLAQDGPGVMAPGVFALDASLKAGPLELRPSDAGDADTIAHADTLDLAARSAGAGVVSLTGTLRPRDGGVLELNALAERLADGAGQPTPDLARVRGTLKGDRVPSAFLDALSGLDGLLAEGLGERATIDAQVRGARLEGEDLSADDLTASLRGARADAVLTGRLEAGVLRLPGEQTVLTVREIRPEMADRVGELLPQVLHLAKRPEDGPATLRVRDLSLPTDGSVEGIDGSLTLALGTARFQASDAFSRILRATGLRGAADVGRRLEPINATISRGALTYEPFALPLGEFTLRSEGSIDLSNERVDVVTWIPVGALTDAAAGAFSTGLGGALGRAVPALEQVSMVPWRTRGPFGATTTSPAPKLLIERRGDQLFDQLRKPGRLIQGLLGGGKGDGGKDDAEGGGGG